MLHEFIALNEDEISSRAKKRVLAREWPSVSPRALEYGVPLFLKQLSETLRSEAAASSPGSGAIGAFAARHGGELLAEGFTVGQVVHDYGDICQTITELAVEQNAPITVAEFHTLNRCLDTAIAEAVTEHTRLTAQAQSAQHIERLGHGAHELRDVLNTAVLAFQALKRGHVAINGSTGAVLGRSLTRLQQVIDRTLAEVRLAAGAQRHYRMSVATFLDEMAAMSALHADERGIAFSVEAVTSDLAINGDQQLLASAVMNLVHNAFKFTPSGGHVVLRAHGHDGHLVIDVEDECGGIPDSRHDPFQAFGDRRGNDRSGLGLGLSIARKAVRAHGGDITIRNIPGIGCVFSIELPLAPEPEEAARPESVPPAPRS